MASPLGIAGPDIGRTFGSLLLGGFVACGLSGVVIIQCIIYFKLYPHDTHPIKALVAASWLIDLIHTTFIFASIWDYFIRFFGVADRFDYIPWTVAFTVVLTAIQTFMVQCYFGVKIFKSSHGNWWITIPIVFLALLRLALACVSTAEMVRLERYSAFTRAYPGWVFTTGLSLSAGVDIIIMICMCYYLHKLRGIATGSTTAVKLINVLMLYTLENGALTCLTALASLITWLTMPENLIFMGLHFVIAKVYANSLLASLNTRQELLALQSGGNITSKANADHQRSTVTALHIQPVGETRYASSSITTNDSEAGLSRRAGGSGRAVSAESPAVIQFRRGSTNLWGRFLEASPAEGVPVQIRTEGGGEVHMNQSEGAAFPLAEGVEEGRPGTKSNMGGGRTLELESDSNV